MQEKDIFEKETIGILLITAKLSHPKKFAHYTHFSLFNQIFISLSAIS
jgi:hypothetical protein